MTGKPLYEEGRAALWWTACMKYIRRKSSVLVSEVWTVFKTVSVTSTCLTLLPLLRWYYKCFMFGERNTLFRTRQILSRGSSGLYCWLGCFITALRVQKNPFYEQI